MANGGDYHVVAITFTGKTIRIRANIKKTNPNAIHPKGSGHTCHSMHAEHNVLRSSHTADTIYVLRFKKDGSLGMAKPCLECEKKIKASRVRKCFFSNEEGHLTKLPIRR